MPEYSHTENLKDLNEKLADIYDHTDLKTGQLIKDIVKSYNKSKIIGVNPENWASIKPFLKQNIAFPLDYTNLIDNASRLRNDKLAEETARKVVRLESKI